MRRFRFSFDLWPLRLNLFNIGHFFGSALMALLWGFWIAWGLGILWEIGDGFKKPDDGSVTGWRQWLFRSDGFSVQDAFVWDLLGCVSGRLLVCFLALF